MDISAGRKWISVLEDFTKIIRISNLLGIGEICLTLSLNVQMSNSSQPTHLAGHLLDCIGGKNAVDCSLLSPD